MVLQQPKSGYYPALTGVRAIAAYLVFFHHFNPILDKQSFAYRFLEQGHIGVTIFYVLSGLLICARYYDRIELSRSWASKYWRNRIARIYPVYLILTVITLLLMEFAPSLKVGVVEGQWLTYSAGQKAIVSFLNVTMLKGFSESFKFSGIGQGWSLTVEECFYLFAPLLFIALHRSKAWFLGGGALLITAGLLLTMLFSRYYFYGFFGSFSFLFNYTFFGRCVEFFMGIGVALYLKRKPFVQSKWPVATVFGLLWIIGVMGLLAYFGIAFDSSTSILTSNVVLPMGVSTLLYGLITERNVLSTLLSSKISDMLGKASYAFYLVHMGAFSAILTRVFHFHVLIQFVLLNVLAIGIYKFVEKPLHKLIRK
jgi:peptidoglycan/LPS O-acetylase OafA/YrhL